MTTNPIRTERMTARANALATLRDLAHDADDLAEIISDFTEGDEFLDSSTGALLETLLMTDIYTLEITQTLEFIDELDPALARLIADQNELCADHYCDIENCTDQH